VTDKLTRDDVFRPQQAKEEGYQTNNVIKDDFGWEIPVDVAPLPSSGIVYAKESTLAGRETVEIRAMTAKDEDILLSQAYIKNGTVITKLIESCLVDKSIDVTEMLSGDRNAIMISTRITGFGSEYNITATCEHCDKEQETSVDLSLLEIKRIGASPIQEGKNLFKVTLPVTNKEVLFKLSTVRSEHEAAASAKRKEKLLGIKEENNILTSVLLRTIDSIGGVTDRNKISKFVENMPVKDSRFLRKYIRDVEPGIDMNTSFTCKGCELEAQVELSLGAGFFWPAE
jgi:hypothetical protein